MQAFFICLFGLIMSRISPALLESGGGKSQDTCLLLVSRYCWSGSNWKTAVSNSRQGLCEHHSVVEYSIFIYLLGESSIPVIQVGK